MKRLIAYLLLVILGGLIQVFATIVISFYNGLVFSPSELIKDGILFFFATSITFSSAFTYFISQKRDSWGLIFTILAVVLVFLFSLTGYSIGLYNELHNGESVHYGKDFYFWGQTYCFFIALVYGIYVEATTDGFNNKTRNTYY